MSGRSSKHDRAEKVKDAKATAAAEAAAMERKATVAAAMAVHQPRPDELRECPPYHEQELKNFSNVTPATQQQLAETHCKLFGRRGACPWGGKCDHLHVADVFRFRAVPAMDSIGGYVAERFLSPVVFANKNAKPNTKMTNAAMDAWRQEIFAARHAKNEARDKRRQTRVTLLAEKEDHQNKEQQLMVAEEATKLLKEDRVTRRELAREHLMAKFGREPAGNSAVPGASRKRDRQLGVNFGANEDDERVDNDETNSDDDSEI